MLKSMRSAGMAVLLGCAMLLSACLPKEEAPEQELQGSKVGQESGGFYGAALGNMAIQIQSDIVGSADWFKSSAEAGLSAPVAHQVQGVPGDIKHSICPVTSGGATSMLQIVWLDGKDSAGNFNMKGTGSSTASILSTLRPRVSADQLGIYDKLTGSIALVDGNPKEIPSDCANLKIPDKAPVVAFIIDRPAKPSSDLYRTEYRSTTCDDKEDGAAQAGSKIQRRTVKYATDGSVTVVADWDLFTLNNCVDTVNIATPESDNVTRTIKATSDLNAALALQKALVDNFKLGCREMTVKATGIDDKKISTCVGGQQAVNKSALKETSKIGKALSNEVMPIQCAGESWLNFTMGGVSGAITAHGNWGGTANIQRSRNVVTFDPSMGTATSIAYGDWTGGSPVNCSATETSSIACKRFEGNLDIASNTKWVDVEEQKTNLGGGASITQTGDMMNPGYFGVTREDTTGIDLSNQAYAKAWEKADLFKPKVTQRSSFSYTGQCTWKSRSLDAVCPTSVSGAGSWDPDPLLDPLDPELPLYNDAKDTLKLPSGASQSIKDALEDDLISRYNALTSSGSLVAKLTSVYKKGSTTYTGSIGYGKDKGFLKRWTTGKRPTVNGRFISPKAVGYRKTMCKNSKVKGDYPNLCASDADDILGSSEQKQAKAMCKEQFEEGKPYINAVSQFCDEAIIQTVFNIGTSFQTRYWFRESAGSNPEYSETALMTPASSRKTVQLSGTTFSIVNTSGAPEVVRCARRDEIRHEVPMKVRYRVYWRFGFWTYIPDMRPYYNDLIGPYVTDWMTCSKVDPWIESMGPACIGSSFLGTVSSLAAELEFNVIVLESSVREWRSDKGWSKKRSAFRTNWGSDTTPSKLPKRIPTVYLCNKKVPGTDNIDDPACDDDNLEFFNKPVI